MSDTNRLMGILKEHDYFERGHCSACGGQEVYNALKEVIRENERLRGYISKLIDYPKIDDWDPLWLEIAKIERPYKESQNEN